MSGRLAPHSSNPGYSEAIITRLCDLSVERSATGRFNRALFIMQKDPEIRRSQVTITTSSSSTCLYVLYEQIRAWIFQCFFACTQKNAFLFHGSATQGSRPGVREGVRSQQEPIHGSKLCEIRVIPYFLEANVIKRDGNVSCFVFMAAFKGQDPWTSIVPCAP